MHREVSKYLEDLLSGAPADSAEKHLNACAACREEIASLRAQAALVRELKASADIEPRPGFYARVMERIEAEGAVSIWNLFAESAFGKRIAVASLALAVLLGIYLVSAERNAEPIVTNQAAGAVADAATVSPATISVVVNEDAPGAVLSRLDQDQQTPNDDMLVNLVTYREQ